MRFNGLTKGFFIFILALVTWAFFDVLSPYFSAILWAAILTTIFNPVKNRLRSALGERNGLASLITIVIICLIVFIPLMVILSSLAIELNVVYTNCNRMTRSSRRSSLLFFRIFLTGPEVFWQNTIWMMSRRSRKNCPMSCCRVDSTSPAARS